MNAEQRTYLTHNAVPATFNVPNPAKCVASTVSTRCDPTATALFQLRRLGYRLQNKCTPEKLHVQVKRLC
jgi:hypothetical protein